MKVAAGAALGAGPTTTREEWSKHSKSRMNQVFPSPADQSMIYGKHHPQGRQGQKWPKGRLFPSFLGDLTRFFTLGLSRGLMVAFTPCFLWTLVALSGLIVFGRGRAA